MNWNKYIWLLVDAGATLADQALDMLMLYEYAANGDWDFFGIGLGTIVIPSLLIGLHGIVWGPSFDVHENVVQCTNFLPGINLFANALRLMRAFLGERYEDRDPLWVERWFEKYEEEYIRARLVEAMLEAVPQTALQVFVALRRPEGIHAGVLYTSLGFSILSLAKTLVTTLVLWDTKLSTLSYPVKVRMFLLSTSYALCEVVSRIFNVALLGYFCGGVFIAVFLAFEYVLIFVILAVRGVCVQNETMRCGLMALSWPLLLQLTSLMCSNEFPFWMLLTLRLLMLAGAVSFALEYDDDVASLTGNAQVFFWTAVVANALWALLMPAFVNSCHELGISLKYTSFEPNPFTNSCNYPLEIHQDDDHDKGVCSCIYSRRTAEVVDKTTDIVEITVGASG